MISPILSALFSTFLTVAAAQDVEETAPADTTTSASAEEDQGLVDAWNDLYALRLGKTARWADETVIRDGLCTARLKTPEPRYSMMR